MAKVSTGVCRGAEILGDKISYSGTRYFQYSYCIFSPYITNRKYQFVCTERNAPDSELQRSHKNCVSSVWTLLHVTLRHQEYGGNT